jgi:hypothetical protein
MAARADVDPYHRWGDVAAVAWETVQALGRRLRRPPDLSWARWLAGAGAHVLALNVLLVALNRSPRVGFWALYYLVGLAALLAGASPCRDDRRQPLAWVWAIGGAVVQTAPPGRHETGAWAAVGLWLAIAGTLWPAPLRSAMAVIDVAGVWAAAGFAALVVWSAIINAAVALLGARLTHVWPGHTLLAETVGVVTAVLTGAAAWYALRTARWLHQRV